MIVAIVALGLRQVYDKKILHAVGTPEYYNERIGRTLEKDEYIRETDFTLSKCDDKAIVCAIDGSNSSFAKTSEISEEGKRK